MLLDFRQCQAVTEDITIDADVRNGDSDLRFIAMAQSRISSAEAANIPRRSSARWGITRHTSGEGQGECKKKEMTTCGGGLRARSAPATSISG
eukprot:scaffold141165_cov30-Tisochrysis_lutea.AAC.7